MLALAALWSVTGPGDGRGFDCAQATAADDVLICQDQLLTRLDSHLGQVYVALRRALTMAASEHLKQDQRAWVFRRNTGCGLSVTTELTETNLPGLTGCFRNAYAERLAFLELMLDVLRAQSAGEPEPTAPSDVPS
jgi:uncharacterized protein